MKGIESATRARLISGEKVGQLTRHESEEMTEHYSAFRLEDFKDVADTQRALVSNFTDGTKYEGWGLTTIPN